MLKIGNCCWLVLLCLCSSCVSSLKKKKKKNSVDKKWSSSVAGRVFTLSFVIPLPYNEWRRVFRSVAIFLFVFALFLPLYKIDPSPKWRPKFQIRYNKLKLKTNTSTRKSTLTLETLPSFSVSGVISAEEMYVEN